MKKNSTARKKKTAKKGSRGLSQGERKQICQLAKKQRLTVGLDLGDRSTRYCILDEAGEAASEGAVETSKQGLSSLLGKMAASRVAMEVGTHSPWASRHVAELGHEVIVANAHRVKLITESVRKNDRIDAEKLARLARMDAKLLSPIRHRGEEAQRDLGVVRARGELMEARTKLINSARGLVKPLGERLGKCDAEQVGVGLAEGLSEAARAMVEPLLRAVEGISEEIGRYDEQIDGIAARNPNRRPKNSPQARMYCRT